MLDQNTRVAILKLHEQGHSFARHRTGHEAVARRGSRSSPRRFGRGAPHRNERKQLLRTARRFWSSMHRAKEISFVCMKS